MNPRLFAVAFAVVPITVLSLVGFLATQISVVLSPLAVLAVAAWMLRRFHARGRLVPEDAEFAGLSVCQFRAWSLWRQLYRALPSDPRCRFCLIPFGGVGRAIGIVPSRKNPNFCPG